VTHKNLKKKDIDGNTCYHLCIEGEGGIETLTKEQWKEVSNKEDNREGDTIWHSMARKGMLKMAREHESLKDKTKAKELLEKNISGETPLEILLRKGGTKEIEEIKLKGRELIGFGNINDKRRTYREGDGVVIDHKFDTQIRMKEIWKGYLERLHGK